MEKVCLNRRYLPRPNLFLASEEIDRFRGLTRFTHVNKDNYLDRKRISIGNACVDRKCWPLWGTVSKVVRAGRALP